MRDSSNEDSSRWDAFFDMDRSVTFSDDDGASSFTHSSISNSDTSENPGRRWMRKFSDGEVEESGDDDSRSEQSYYESGDENSTADENDHHLLEGRKYIEGRNSGGEDKSVKSMKSMKSVKSMQSMKSNNDQSAFSNFINQINSSKSDKRELTLIPIGGAAQAQYMILTPRNDIENNSTRILSPHSIRSVSLMKGLANNKNSTKRKIFKVKAKKTPEKKEFLKVHPKKLEERYEIMKEKYETMREKQRARKAQKSMEKSMEKSDTRREIETEVVEIEKGTNDLKDTLPLFSTLSRIITSSKVEINNYFDDESESSFEDEVESEKKKTPISILRSFSKIHSSSTKQSSEIDDLENEEPKDNVGNINFLNFRNSQSRSSSRNGKEIKMNSTESTFVSKKDDSVDNQIDQAKAAKVRRSWNSKELKMNSTESTFVSKKDDPVEIQMDQTKSDKVKKSRRIFSFHKLFKFDKRKDSMNSSSIDLQSDSSFQKTQLGPNKVLSMVRTPIKPPDLTSLKEDDTIQNELVVFYYFGGDSKQSMDHIKKKEELIPGEDSEEVLVMVEASTVSKTDSDIRNERLWTSSDKSVLPITPGVDFVGKVVRCGRKATLNHGINVDDRVASLTQTGGNCKFLSEHANQLVHVPKKVKAHEAAVMIEIYLSAFQILLFGVKGDDRYENRPLKGKEILVIGGISTVNQAVIELAVFLGAKNVYTTAAAKHYNFLQDLGATTLDMRTQCWLPLVQGKMDMSIDSNCDDNYDSPWKALNSRGKLICHGMQTIMNEEPGCINSLEQIWARTKSACMPRTYYYDVYTHWELNLEESKKDLGYLFHLLEKKALHPSIADTLPLRKVPKAHAFLDASRRIQGSFVCLPHSEG